MLKRRGGRQVAVRNGKAFWFVMLSPLVAFLCALPVGCNSGNSSVAGCSCTLDDVTSGSKAIPVADSRSFLKRIPILPALRNIGSTQRDTPPSPRPHAPACFLCWIFFFSSMLHIYLYASPVAFRDAAPAAHKVAGGTRRESCCAPFAAAHACIEEEAERYQAKCK